MEANEAMVAKARAMFGNRLQASQYDSLIRKKSLDDIVTFLKKDTMYKDILQDVNNKAIHRGRLEQLLRADLFARLEKLLRYGNDSYGRFMMAAVMHTEIDLILGCIRALMDPDGDDRERMITDMPVYADRFLSFDIRQLASVRTYDDLLRLLKETQYYRVIKHFRVENPKEIDGVNLEHDLRGIFFRNLLEMVDQCTRGEEHETMKYMVLVRAELENIAMIYRMKKFFHISGEEIRRRVSDNYCRFTPKEVNRMIEEDDADRILEEVKKKYGKYVKDDTFHSIENYTDHIVYRMYYNMMETGQEAHIVMLSYLQLSLIEIDNLVKIIEGVRYRVSSERIRALLVY